LKRSKPLLIAVRFICSGTASLEPVAVAAIQGEVCLCGIQLVEDDGIPDPFAEVADETMEIMIHPD
jgi:hypothetical protein